MKNRNRSYKRGEPFRDFRKFVIVSEGEREDRYFSAFNPLSSRIDVVIVDREPGKSAVNFFQERIDAYKIKHELLKEDFVWFVLDVDKWVRKEIEDLNETCSKQLNWNLAISNPCFEVWLHYHVRESIPPELDTCRKLKTNLGTFTPGGLSVSDYVVRVNTAIRNAEAMDKHPSTFFPDVNVTKTYQLARQMSQVIGLTGKILP